jgi:drug/metabolite transporter (DMT)-like permease
MVPLFIVMIDWLRPKGTKPSWIVLAGVILGFLGVAFLINPTGLGGVTEFDVTGTLIVVAAGLFWAIGSVYSRYVPQSISQIQFAGMQMIGGGLVAILIGVSVGEISAVDFNVITTKSIMSWAYLTTIGSFAYGVYIWLLKASTPARVATYAYVNPVIALLLGAALAGENLSAWTIGCSAVIIFAVAIIITAKARAQKIVLELEENLDTGSAAVATAQSDSGDSISKCC